MENISQASPAGYERVLRAFDELTASKDELAALAGCSRPTLNRFIAGQPIDSQDFQALCRIFGLDYRTVVDGAPTAIKPIALPPAPAVSQQPVIPAMLQASPQGYEKVYLAFESQSFSKDELAAQANCSRPTLNKFVAGQPIDRADFKSLCRVFGLGYREIADEWIDDDEADDNDEIGAVLPPALDMFLNSGEPNDSPESMPKPQLPAPDLLSPTEISPSLSPTPTTPELTPVVTVAAAALDLLVDTTRKQLAADIQERCGQVRILEMARPLSLREIYVQLEVLTDIPHQNCVDFAEMLTFGQSKDFGRLSLGLVTANKISGQIAVERYSHLLVWGKLGAGKTTFLKWLAQQCHQDDRPGRRVPLFINLRDFAADVETSLLAYVERRWAVWDSAEMAQPLLQAGRVLILLDDGDGIKDAAAGQIWPEILAFIAAYPQCPTIITARPTAALPSLAQFTAVELADFDEVQMAAFVTRWFQAQGDPFLAQQLLAKLQAQQSLQELGTNPLYLSLLCLHFLDATVFPLNRSELYRSCLDVSLYRWDIGRNVDRSQIYTQISLAKPIDLLKKMAFETFERQEYFFQQSTVELYIADYICHLPHAERGEVALRHQSQAIIATLVGQQGWLVERAKGIYSFAHLTCHEYLAAKWLVDSAMIQSALIWRQLANHAGEKRWREIFSIVLELLPNASCFLRTLKEEIDRLLAGDEKLQNFLVWLYDKCQSMQIEGNSIQIYLFYLVLDISLARYTYFALDLSLSPTFALDLYLYLALFRSHYLSQAIESAISAQREEFLGELQELYQQLPSDAGDFSQWQEQHLPEWRSQLRSVMIQHCNIGHDWQFTPKQQDCLDRYYLANKLLKDCLESNCYIDYTTRQYLTDTFCRPMQLIEEYSQN